ncbi:MAG: hypothetical protein N2255_05765 [Kiritimatiellae bacterium]|nr:hypothetical protein [Kiritimatiellia bacterium]
MKSTFRLAIVTISLAGMWGVLCTAQNPALWPPPVLTLPEALQIAQEYVRTNKIDVSNHFLASVTLSVSEGKDYWDVTWLNTNRCVKGNWFLLRVDMSKKVELRQGQ